jgi:hypothetical protein
MKRAAAIEEFINLRAFCAIVDSLVAKDDSPESSHSEVLEQLAYQGIMQDDDGKKLLYQQLVAGPESTDWLDHSAQEWDRLIEKTKTLAFVPVSRKPKDKKATYIKQNCTEKVKPPALEPEKRVRAIAGGDKVDYGGDTAAYTAGLKTVKTLWNSVLSTINARFMTKYIKDFYLHTRLESPEYAWVSLAQIPPATQAKYYVENLVVNGKVLVEITGGIYGLPQSGLLAQKDLIKLLEANGYYMTTTNCLFRHRTRDIYFSLIVDDFGVNYTKEEDVNHLIGVLGTKYKTHIDWSGTRFLGITLAWDYTSPIRSVTTSMPDFVIKALKRYGYNFSQPPALSPGGWVRPQNGVKQHMVAVDNSPPLSADESIRLMSIIGTFLWYCRVLDYTGLVALGRLGQEVAHPTKALLDWVHELLRYFASFSIASVTYFTSDMLLRAHTDASYLSERNAGSRLGDIEYFGSEGDEDKPPTNGCINVVCCRSDVVVASACEAEWAAIFKTCREMIETRQRRELRASSTSYHRHIRQFMCSRPIQQHS